MKNQTNIKRSLNNAETNIEHSIKVKFLKLKKTEILKTNKDKQILKKEKVDFINKPKSYII